MTPELIALALSALLQIVQFAFYAVPANKELGTRYTMSSRDQEPEREMSEITARQRRAFENHFEGLILFGIAVGIVQMSGQNSMFTAICAWVYLIARIGYVPAYVFGWNPARSYIWFFGFIATVSLLIAALL
ncbi:MAG: MAPEG family protein [Pseudomonadota bacterium]